MEIKDFIFVAGMYGAFAILGFITDKRDYALAMLILGVVHTTCVYISKA